MTTISPVGNNIPYANLINNASDKYQVPATLIAAVIKKESSFVANARSGPGAGGLMQLMPRTAASLGVTNVWDPAQNIDGGTKYLAQQLKSFNGNIPLALSAYNAGPGNVHGTVPNIPETQDYVKKIMADYAGGNIDPGSITATGAGTDGGTNPFNIGATIVNGIQKIFQTLATDFAKMVLYLILFAVFVFFGYKAIQGSPPISEFTGGIKRGGRSVTRAVKSGQQKRYQAKKTQYNEELRKVKDRTPSDLKKGAELLAKIPK